MRFGVVLFPGSNCEMDCQYVLREVLHEEADLLWHKEEKISGYDAIVLPGGFSYGDYLRTGAIARFSPIMKSVERFAASGGLVLGICNGFQILCEAGLLPGALMRNRSLHFICKHVHIRVENRESAFTNACHVGQALLIPINHNEGCYYADQETLKRLNERGQVLFRYCGREGEVSEAFNPNGSLENIAGIMNEAGNVMGMMP
ncbi:MAG: phosphoribosylformylglycinamidine synthase subunit PurQ, partial [candidate division NC10 bacterium]|nr:phosphoribosylformylglycinamidine synthase subunit PurQ [candidate division NC10 bacterium]